MKSARKARSSAERNANPRIGGQSLKERATALREEADRLLAAASQEGKAQPVDSESKRLSKGRVHNHDSKRKSSGAKSGANPARTKRLRTDNAMGRHEFCDVNSSVAVGRNGVLSADDPDSPNFNAPDLSGFALSELSALFDVCSQIHTALLQASWWPKLGDPGRQFVDGEFDRMGRLREAIHAELQARVPADAWEAEDRGECLARLAVAWGELDDAIDIIRETQGFVRAHATRRVA